MYANCQKKHRVYDKKYLKSPLNRPKDVDITKNIKFKDNIS